MNTVFKFVQTNLSVTLNQLNKHTMVSCVGKK